MDTRFFLPVRIYYEDTDAGGVVYHANYLKFFERASTERLRHMGYELDELRRSSGILFVVKSAHINYLKPAQFGNVIMVSADVSEIKRASMTFTQEIRLDTPEGDKLCEANIRIACLTDGELRPTAIPSPFLEQLKNAI